MRSSQLRTTADGDQPATRFLRLALLLVLIAVTGKAAATSTTRETEATMDYEAHMKQMLQVLGCYGPPVYGSQGLSTYTLTLHGLTNQGPAISFGTRRESIADAIQEMARLAVLYLARVHAAELAGTVYRLYPAAASRSGAAPRLQRPLVEGEEDATVAQLARLALTQACFADRTAAELRRTQAALDAAQERIAKLQRTQAELKAARKKISELRGAQDRLRDARKRIAMLCAEVDTGRKRIADLEEAYFYDSPEDEDLIMEEEQAHVQVQQQQQQPEEEVADSEAPDQPEEEDDLNQAAAALVSSPTICYTRRRHRGHDGK